MLLPAFVVLHPSPTWMFHLGHRSRDITRIKFYLHLLVCVNCSHIYRYTENVFHVETFPDYYILEIHCPSLNFTWLPLKCLNMKLLPWYAASNKIINPTCMSKPSSWIRAVRRKCHWRRLYSFSAHKEPLHHYLSLIAALLTSQEKKRDENRMYFACAVAEQYLPFLLFFPSLLERSVDQPTAAKSKVGLQRLTRVVPPVISLHLKDFRWVNVASASLPAAPGRLTKSKVPSGVCWHRVMDGWKKTQGPG